MKGRPDEAIIVLHGKKLKKNKPFIVVKKNNPLGSAEVDRTTNLEWREPEQDEPRAHDRPLPVVLE